MPGCRFHATAIAIWGATGWGIQGPQQYRLVRVAPAIAPVVLGLNTAATYLGVTTAGILGGIGLHVVGPHHLSLLSAGVFVIAIATSQLAGRLIAVENPGRRFSQLAGSFH